MYGNISQSRVVSLWASYYIHEKSKICSILSTGTPPVQSERINRPNIFAACAASHVASVDAPSGLVKAQTKGSPLQEREWFLSIFFVRQTLHVAPYASFVG